MAAKKLINIIINDEFGIGIRFYLNTYCAINFLPVFQYNMNRYPTIVRGVWPGNLGRSVIVARTLENSIFRLPVNGFNILFLLIKNQFKIDFTIFTSQ